MRRVLWVLVFVGLVLSPVVVGQQTEIPLPEGAIARFGLGTIYDIAYSPDGDLIAVGTSLGVELRDARTLELIRFLTGHTGRVYSVAFSPDGETLASGSSDDTIKLWDVSRGLLICTLIGHTNYVYSVAFSPDGETLASGSWDNTIKLWDVSRGLLICTLTGHTSNVNSVAFSPDGETLASGASDKTIKLWDVSSGVLVRTLTGHTNYVYSVAFSPDGETLASGSWDDTIKLWDVSSGALLRTLTGHTNYVLSVAFSPDDETLMSGSWDATIKLWDVSSGVLVRTLTGHMADVESVAFSPDGETLASGADDGTIKLWDVSSGVLVRTLTGHMADVESVAFSPDGEMLASGARDDTIKLWNVSSGVLIRTLTGHTSYVRSVTFSPDGETLASGSLDITIKLWDVSSGALLRTLTGPSAVDSVAFSPDGETLASGSRDDTIKLWDVSSGALLHMLTGHKSNVYSVAFSPDGETLASGSDDSTIKLWDVSSGGVLLRTLTGHKSNVYSVAFSPDGATLASGSTDDTIKLWDVSSGVLLRTLTGHTNWVRSVAFSPDGATLASGSRDDTIKLWDVSSGVLLRTLTGHTNWVWSVAFSPDGETLASGSFDGTVLLWDVAAIVHPNDQPTATFTWQVLSSSGTRLVVEPRTGDQIEFDASSSSDSDGQIGEYAWDWDSNGSYNETTTDPVIEYVFASSGSHQVTLRVTDDDGATGTLTKMISIGAKQSPVAAFVLTPSSPSTLDTIQFTDSSSDPDGSISSWNWNFGDGLTSTSRNPSHRFTEKGTFTVQLTVTDNDNLSDSVTKAVTIRNLLPEARFSIHPPGPLPHQPISFDASQSSDADGEILFYRWDFTGDGTPDLEGVNATWTFSEPGEYEITLVVEDNDRATASSAQQITIADIPQGSPGFSDLWAVVVGVGTYQDTRLSHLGLPEDDARAVYDYLVDRQGGGFLEDHVRLLLNEDATKNAIEQSWGWLLRQADEDDLVVIYFAGHGGYDDDYNGDEPEGDTQDEYLLPYDTDVSDMYSTAIRDDTVGDWVRSLRSKSVILIFDSCYAGGATRSSRGYAQPGSRSGPGNTVFTDLVGEGLLIMAACQAAETAKQDDGLGHGVFTYFLLSGLGGLAETNEILADADSDERVSVEELRVYLEQAVPEYVSSMVPSRSPQNPLISGDDALREVALNGYGIPLIGEVITVQDDQVLISLGSRHGVQAGDRFEVVCIYAVPDGSTIEEVRGVVEVVYILAANRATCRIMDVFQPIEQGDQVRPVQE